MQAALRQGGNSFTTSEEKCHGKRLCFFSWNYAMWHFIAAKALLIHLPGCWIMSVQVSEIVYVLKEGVGTSPRMCGDWFLWLDRL